MYIYVCVCDAFVRSFVPCGAGGATVFLSPQRTILTTLTSAILVGWLLGSDIYIYVCVSVWNPRICATTNDDDDDRMIDD